MNGEGEVGLAPEEDKDESKIEDVAKKAVQMTTAASAAATGDVE